jgi:hypothetical protein
MSVYRQNQNAAFGGEQPVAYEQQADGGKGSPLIFAEEFMRGGRQPVPFKPNGQLWNPAMGIKPGDGLDAWALWSADGNADPFSWIDASRQSGMLLLNNAGVIGGFAWVQMYRPAPQPPAAFFLGTDEAPTFFRYNLYSRCFALGISPDLGTFNELWYGLALNFSALPADGVFVQGGWILQGAANGGAQQAVSVEWTDHITPNLQTVGLSFGQFVRLLVTCEKVTASVSTTVQVDHSQGGKGWIPWGSFVEKGVPTFCGLGGSVRLPLDETPQSAAIAMDDLRAYLGTLNNPASNFLVTDGGHQQI